jgi:hypothetical protein
VTHELNLNHNPGLEFLGIYNKKFSQIEDNTNNLISELNQISTEIGQIQKLSTALTHAKKEKKADFTNDEEMKQIIDSIQAFAPGVLGHVGQADLYVFKTEADIDSAIKGLDGQVQMHMNLVQQKTMFISECYEQKGRLTENAQELIKMIIRHLESIVSKTRPR